MLRIYDYDDEQLSAGFSFETYPPLRFTASGIMEELGYPPEQIAIAALERAMHACAALHISVQQNFRKIYCWKEGQMITDWQLSALAGYLFMVNCDPHHPLVARAQLLFMLKQQQR